MSKPATYRVTYRLVTGEMWTLIATVDKREGAALSRAYRKAIAGVGHVAVFSHGYRLCTTSITFVDVATGLCGLCA